MVLACLLYRNLALAKDLGIAGRTWKIVEPDLIEVIHQEIEKGKWKEGMTKENFRKLALELQPGDRAKPLPRALKARSFEPDMTYRLDMDLIGPDGRILYPKGFEFDPSAFVTLTRRYLVLDPEDLVQLAWFAQSEFKRAEDVTLLAQGGSYLKLSEDWKRPVYYLPRSVRARFRLQAVPCLIEQVDGKIRVTEIKVGP